MTTAIGGTMPKLEVSAGRIAIPVAGGLEIIPVIDIEWLESDGNYVHLYIDGCPKTVRATLRGFSSRLDRTMFRQVHRSTVVNVSRVVGLRAGINGDGTIVLAGGQCLRLSRRFRQSLWDLLL